MDVGNNQTCQQCYRYYVVASDDTRHRNIIACGPAAAVRHEKVEPPGCSHSYECCSEVLPECLCSPHLITPYLFIPGCSFLTNIIFLLSTYVSFRLRYHKIGMNYTEYRCLNVSNFDVEDDEPSWTQSSSPWSTPRECWWPLDTEDERLCTVDQYGQHKCLHDPRYMNETEFRYVTGRHLTCNDDTLSSEGNPRQTRSVGAFGTERAGGLVACDECHSGYD